MVAYEVYKDVEYEVDGAERYVPVTVGVEIEAEFVERRFPVHQQLAGGFADWFAGTDPTIEFGAEIRSPILNGVAGLAEIVATADVLAAGTAYVKDNCGQHTTVGHPGARERNIDWPQRMFNLFEALEEALYAFTGDAARMWNGYGSASKPYVGDGFRMRSGDVVEMRYPPGTLDTTQMAVNVGVCQLLAILAYDMRLNESRDMRREAWKIYQSSGAGCKDVSGENLEYALDFLAEQGWCEGGCFYGLPYDPDVRTVVTLDDRLKGEYKVLMPGRKELEGHMATMVEKFSVEAEIV